MDKTIYCIAHQELRRLLRQARKDAGLTQLHVAKRLGLPQSFVSKYESRERRLDVVELRNVCGALNLSMVDFVRSWNDTLNEA